MVFANPIPVVLSTPCLCRPTQAAQRAGPKLNFVSAVQGGECCGIIVLCKMVLCQTKQNEICTLQNKICALRNENLYFGK